MTKFRKLLFFFGGLSLGIVTIGCIGGFNLKQLFGDYLYYNREIIVALFFCFTVIGLIGPPIMSGFFGDPVKHKK